MYWHFYTPAPRRGRGYTVLTLSVHPSVQDIFVAFFSVTVDGRNLIFGSQASYRYTILWVAFLDPSDSYFLFADLVGFYTHWTYICTFFVTFFSATIDGRNLIFGHKLHIGTPYRGKRFWTHQIPTSCLPTVDCYTHWTYICICSFFVAFFSATIDGRNLIVLYLILSTISIFIPVSGGVGRGQVHCFAQGGGGYNAVKTTLNQGRSKAYMKCSYPVISREWSMECWFKVWFREHMQPKPPAPERSFLNVASVSNVCCHVIFVSNFF